VISDRPAKLLTQGFAFGWTGVIAALVHYGLLIALVQRFAFQPTIAALAGYLAGGVTSYLLNRCFTFPNDRPHGEAAFRFFLVAFVGFCLTGAAMHVLVVLGRAPYLPAQIVTTCIVAGWSFLAHRFWTFRRA
jgi:putative flippase GtrA